MEMYRLRSSNCQGCLEFRENACTNKFEQDRPSSGATFADLVNLIAERQAAGRRFAFARIPNGSTPGFIGHLPLVMKHTRNVHQSLARMQRSDKRNGVNACNASFVLGRLRLSGVPQILWRGQRIAELKLAGVPWSLALSHRVGHTHRKPNRQVNYREPRIQQMLQTLQLVKSKVSKLTCGPL